MTYSQSSIEPFWFTGVFVTPISIIILWYSIRKLKTTVQIKSINRLRNYRFSPIFMSYVKILLSSEPKSPIRELWILITSEHYTNICSFFLLSNPLKTDLVIYPINIPSKHRLQLSLCKILEMSADSMLVIFSSE